MNISDETIDYVAKLVKIELTLEEKEKAKKELSKIITYMDCMKELGTEEMAPMSHGISLTNVYRDDVITNGPEQTAMLGNAPSAKDGCFQVPKTVEA